MIVKPKVRGFICTTAHPDGCAANVNEAIASIRAQNRLTKDAGPKRVLVIGASTGYGLASRLMATFGCGAETIGVFFERAATEKKTATAGWYNSVAFEKAAQEAGVKAWSINGDAFSDDIKKQVIALIKKYWPEGVDLVIYSVAAPRRTDPTTGEVYQSCLKTLDKAYTNTNLNIHTGAFNEVTIEPASSDEVANTKKVMGGEDWALWIDALLKNNCLAKGALTLAYSYIGPKVTEPMYRSGTIGEAKKHLEATANRLNQLLERAIDGHAYVSVNKAVVTQAAAAIPVLPLYCAILFKVMQEAGLHEGCTEQAIRLFQDKIYNGAEIKLDDNDLIRLDDYELRDDIQQQVQQKFAAINADNLDKYADLNRYRKDFMRLFGFEHASIDYDCDISPIRSIASIQTS